MTVIMQSILIVLFSIVFAFKICAQGRIAAVVNDDVISQYDIENRLDFVISTSALSNTYAIRQRLLPRILQNLIDERLKIQEARSLHFNINDKEITAAISVIENQNNLPHGGFEQLISKKHLDRATAIEQVRAEIAWYKVIQHTIKPRVRIDEDEIDATVQRIRDSVVYPVRRLLSEIFLPVDNLAQEEGTRILVEYLIRRFKNGEDFQDLARKFSQAASAVDGGDLGWILKGQLDPEIDANLAHINSGDLSQPIRTTFGYNLFFVREQKNISTYHYEDTIFSISQLVIPINGPKALSPETRSKVIEAARNASSCSEIEALAPQTGSLQSGPIGKIKARDVPSITRDILMSLNPHITSTPIRIDNTLVMMMICERIDPPIPDILPREEIARQLEGERIISLRYRKLQDLRHSALVEIRL